MSLSVKYSLGDPFGGVNFGQDFGMTPMLGTAQLIGIGGLSTPATTPATTLQSFDASVQPGTDWSGAMGNASIGLSVGQAIGGAYAAWQSGKTAKYVAKMEAKVAENNRQIGQMGAEAAFRKGESEIARLTMQAGELKAKQRAGFAKSGVALGEGSVRETTASTDIKKAIDVSTLRMNALSEAWGYKRQAASFGAQAGVSRAYGNAAYSAGIGNAIGSLMEGGVTVADRWQKYYGSNS